MRAAPSSRTRDREWPRPVPITCAPAHRASWTAVDPPAPLPAGRDDIKKVVFVQESSRAQLTELARLVDEGHLRPQVAAVYPLAQAAQAYSAKAAGGMPGRVVLQP